MIYLLDCRCRGNKEQEYRNSRSSPVFLYLTDSKFGDSDDSKIVPVLYGCDSKLFLCENDGDNPTVGEEL